MSGYDVVFKSFGAASHTADVGTDLWTGVKFILRGDLWWGSLTIGCVVFSMLLTTGIICCAAIKYWHWKPRKAWLLVVCFPFTPLGFIIWDLKVTCETYRRNKSRANNTTTSGNTNPIVTNNEPDTSNVANNDDQHPIENNANNESSNNADGSNNDDGISITIDNTSRSSNINDAPGIMVSDSNTDNNEAPVAITNERSTNNSSNNPINTGASVIVINDTNNDSNSGNNSSTINDEAPATITNISNTDNSTSGPIPNTNDDNSNNTSDDKVPRHMKAAAVAKGNEAFTEAAPQCCIGTHVVFQTLYVIGGTVYWYQWVSLVISICSLSLSIATNDRWGIKSKRKKALIFALLLPIISSRLMICATLGTIHSAMFLLPIGSEYILFIPMAFCCTAVISEDKAPLAFAVGFSSINIGFGMGCMFISAVPIAVSATAFGISLMAAPVQVWALKIDQLRCYHAISSYIIKQVSEILIFIYILFIINY